ncbi:hypothetical protein LMIY3S_00066 [Labrys miyagiensis]
MWFHFDEAFDSIYQMKLGNSDMSFKLTVEKEFFRPAISAPNIRNARTFKRSVVLFRPDTR